MNSFNQYGSGNQQIGTQNNYYGQKNSSITIFIDIDLLEAWYKNNSVDVSPIMKSIKSAKMSYLKDEKTIIKVETERLISLQDTHEDLIDSDILYDIQEEKERCERIKILIKLINLKILCIEQKFIILNILYRIYHREALEKLISENDTECNFNYVNYFLSLINDLETDIDNHIEEELSKWDKLNRYSASADEELKKARANFKKYLYNFSPEINSLKHQIKNDLELFVEEFEDFYQWVNIPFLCKVTFDNKYKYEYHMFNINLERRGRVDSKYFPKYLKMFWNGDNYLKITLYTVLIYYYFDNFKDSDDFELFYTNNIKNINIEYDPEQKELRRLVQTYTYPSLETIEPNKSFLNNWLKNIHIYYSYSYSKIISYISL